MVGGAMGLMKQTLTENNFNKKKAERALNIDDNTKCKYCSSREVDYEKIMGYGNKMGVVYHYKLICECGKRYFIKRDKIVYNIVRDKKWKKTKSYRKKFN